MHRILKILSITILILILFTSCNLQATGTSTPVQPPVTEPPATQPPVSATSAAGDSVAIISLNPPSPAGISIVDPITLFAHYKLTLPNGMFQVWFERFEDPDCTVLGHDAAGNTTLGGTLESIESGERDITVNISPIALVEAAYVGVGVRLWSADGTQALVEDMNYANCYAVKVPPAAVAAPPPVVTPIAGAPAGVGAISGIVYGDLNHNGRMDGGESGGGPYALTLSDRSCLTTLSNTASDANGNYLFPSLPAGTYCVVINYTTGSVLPGTFQRIEVLAGNTSMAYFGLQIGSSAPPPPPPSTGFCGDGTVDGSLGEQCDPPNTIDCTATCQSYVGYCGNGIVDASLGESCDPPNVTDCTASCQTYVGWCGNGIVDAGESCDPPNITDCTASCQSYTPVCGNGIVDSGESCDPPNVTDCTASCQLYLPNCGNGALDLGEECDPPNTTDCTAQCQIWP